VSGFVLPGDRVDVLVTVDSRTMHEDAVTRTVLQNIEVLAAGQKTEQRDNRPITVQAVTLLVTPEGAETLALALHEGKIHLVLRNPEDQDEVNVASLSTRQMLGQTGARPAARRAPARTPTPVVGVRADKPKVRIIRSASVSETPAVTDTTSH
jgi:pilus assembly protein CpaB